MATCKNHPERNARRTCYQCKAAICPSCQHHLDHHIFCSHACHRDWRRAALRARIGQRLRRWAQAANPLIWWRYPAFKRTQWAQRATLLLWTLLLLQAATAATLWLNARTTSQAALAVHAIRTVAPAAAPQWVTAPTYDAGLVRAAVRAGSAPVVVLRDGREVAQAMPGELTVVTVRAGATPEVWHLATADTRDHERWLWPGVPPRSIAQVAGAKGIALTFDGGAHNNLVGTILAVLRAHGVRATFFLTGQFIENFPADTRRIAMAGHEVGNHTYSHAHLTTYAQNRRHDTRPDIDVRWLEWELLKTEHLFTTVTGMAMAPLWRAPYGEINAEIDAWARDLGYRHVGWTVRGGRTRSLDTLDWVSDPRDPLYVSGKDMAQRIVTLARKPEFQGGIVLMHVGVERRHDRVQDELSAIVALLKAANVPLVTVSDLLREG